MNKEKKLKILRRMEIEILSGEEEAEIGILGALGHKDGGIIDIGGASTEIIVRTDGQIAYEKSVDIGVVRLKDMCGREYSALASAAQKAVQTFGCVPTNQTMYAIGGTATTLGALSLGLQTYDSLKVTGVKITREQMSEMAAMLLQMPVEEIAN